MLLAPLAMGLSLLSKASRTQLPADPTCLLPVSSGGTSGKRGRAGGPGAHALLFLAHQGAGAGPAEVGSRGLGTGLSRTEFSVGQ